MPHLSPQQLVDLVEGRHEGDADGHLRACEACRAQLDELRQMLALTSADRVPEPSPLFFEHLSGRVAEAVRREPQPGTWWQAWAWPWGAVSAVAVVVIAAGLGVLWRPLPGPSPAAVQEADAASAPITTAESADPLAGIDPSWALMEALSDDVVFDEVATSGVIVSPGSADRAMLQLSETERARLLSILREEMTRPAGADPGPDED